MNTTNQSSFAATVKLESGEIKQIVSGQFTAEEANEVANALINLALRIREAITEPQA